MAVNISTDTNTVKVTPTSTNNVTVVDNGNNTSISVSQPTTRVIKVATVGLTGPQGPPGSSVDTGSFATTGSNAFIGNQTIQGDLLISGSDNVNSTLRFLSGAVITTNGSNLDMTAGPGGWSEIGSNSGQNYVWVDDSGVYLVSSWDSNTQTSAWRILTGSRQLVAVGDLDMNGHVVTGSLLGTASFATTASYVLNAGVAIDTSSFATTGSNTFIGNQIISGAVNTTGLLTIQNAIATPAGQYFVAYSDTSTELSWQAPFTPSSPVYSGINSTPAGTSITNTSTDSNGDALPSKTWSFNIDGTLTAPGGITAESFTGSLQGTASYATQAISASYVQGYVLNSNTSSFVTNSQTSSFATTGSVTFTGSQIVTGSTRGNVTALTITSNTASMNLSTGNFFTLQLVQGTNTFINPSNILPGQTSILTLSTTGSATVSFPSSVKQPSGSAYVPTTTTGVDIVTLASVDSSTLYVVGIKNMI